MKQKEFLNTILPCKNTLYRLAKRLLVSSDEAEDAVQEVFLKLWKGRDKINNYRSPEAFAITVTKNYCLDRLKSKQASNLKIVHSNYKNSENIERTIEGNERVELVTKIMETLPEKQKMIITGDDILIEYVNRLIVLIENIKQAFTQKWSMASLSDVELLIPE